MKMQLIDRVCPVCGKAYKANPTRLKWGRETTCSRLCSYALRAKKLENSVRLICPVCGKEFVRAQSRVKGKYGAQYCSPECHYKGRSIGLTRRVVTRPYKRVAEVDWKAVAAKTVATRRARNNYQHSEATKRRLSVATARAIARMKPGHSSKLEDIVASQLDMLRVNYVRQRPFRDRLGRFAFVVDFWLPDLNCALEVNGTFFHADPRFYPEPVSPIQRRNIEKYRRKLKSLEAMGIKVVEVWEADIKTDPLHAVRTACSKAGMA